MVSRMQTGAGTNDPPRLVGVGLQRSRHGAHVPPGVDHLGGGIHVAGIEGGLVALHIDDDVRGFLPCGEELVEPQETACGAVRRLAREHHVDVLVDQGRAHVGGVGGHHDPRNQRGRPSSSNHMGDDWAALQRGQDLGRHAPGSETGGHEGPHRRSA